MTAGSALVGAMATDGWQQARAAVVDWWRRRRPDAAEAVGSELEVLRGRVLDARARSDGDTEGALAGSWRLRLQELLNEEPSLAGELQRLLEEHLAPALSADERERGRSVVMRAEAHGDSRVYMAGRDQHITGS
ncbi:MULTISPECIES: hypothetical protein [Streptomyces]|uniref:hypothetical protein n=1 Tax=Streptomyces TaxID=1883 RepID=UPI0021B07861|nr:hypothetical protein [Streptomyces sp. WAC05292]